MALRDVVSAMLHRPRVENFNSEVKRCFTVVKPPYNQHTSSTVRNTINHLLLKALDDLPDEPPGHAVRLDHDEGLLGVCHIARLDLNDARSAVRNAQRPLKQAAAIPEAQWLQGIFSAVHAAGQCDLMYPWHQPLPPIDHQNRGGSKNRHANI